MRIAEFGVEQWMNEFETRCAWNLAETCIESLTVAELLELSGEEPEAFTGRLLPMQLTYGAIEGSDRLRDLVAGLYEGQTRHNVVITHGAIGANQLAHLTLVEPGDRVVAVVPTYQQHYSIPASIGADVELLRLGAEHRWLPDLDRLSELVTPGTRLIAVNNPNNPTGSLMERALLEQVAAIADRVGAYVLCDEVYRGTDHHGDGYTASIADVYHRGISTGSMSKTYSLAGLRLGWLTGPTSVIREACIQRDYNTISVGMLDDLLAALALEHRGQIAARNHAIVRGNLQSLDTWVSTQPLIDYVKPSSGTTALLRYDLDTSSRDLCVDLLQETGVLLTPGSALDVEGHLRIGYANNPDVLREGLDRFATYLSHRDAS